MGEDIVKWADRAMFEAAPMEKDESGRVVPKVHLLWATPDPLGAIAAACRMYEGKPTYNLSDITDDERRHYWEQVQNTHLKAPLEFVQFHFFIEGVTRAFTHQMVRQRTAVYAQESLRFAVKENLADEVAIPPSIAALPADHPRREQYLQAIKRLEETYHNLVNAGIPAEDARSLLPHATTTRLNYNTNLRALLDHAGNRLCTQAQFEWRAVFISLIRAVKEYVPHRDSDDYVQARYEWQYPHMIASTVFKPICYSLGKCPFMAVFDRQCTIRERVNEGKFNEINPLEWMADPTAGRRA